MKASSRKANHKLFRNSLHWNTCCPIVWASETLQSSLSSLGVFVGMVRESSEETAYQSSLCSLYYSCYLWKVLFWNIMVNKYNLMLTEKVRGMDFWHINEVWIWIFFSSAPHTVLLCSLKSIRSGLYLFSWKSVKILISGLCLCS